jgi:hypothetical protein
MESTIKGGATLVNPQRTSRAGERRSDQFRDCFSSEAHTRGAKQPVKRAPVLENVGLRLRLEAPLDDGCRHLGHGRPPQFAGLAAGGGALTAGGGGGGLTAGGGGAGRATAGGGRITAAGGGGGRITAGGGGGGLVTTGGGAGLIIAGGGGAGLVTTGGGGVGRVTTGAGPVGLDTTGEGSGGRCICCGDGSDVG